MYLSFSWKKLLQTHVTALLVLDCNLSQIYPTTCKYSPFTDMLCVFQSSFFVTSTIWIPYETNPDHQTHAVWNVIPQFLRTIFPLLFCIWLDASGLSIFRFHGILRTECRSFVETPAECYRGDNWTFVGIWDLSPTVK